MEYIDSRLELRYSLAEFYNAGWARVHELPPRVESLLLLGLTFKKKGKKRNPSYVFYNVTVNLAEMPQAYLTHTQNSHPHTHSYTTQQH